MRRGFAIGVGILLLVMGVAGLICPAKTMSRENAEWIRARSEAHARGENPDAIPKPDRLYDAPTSQYVIAAALCLGGIACLFWRRKPEQKMEASEPAHGG